MSFALPDLATLIARIAGDIEAQLPGTDARLRRNLLAILGRTLAGAAHGLYGHQRWLKAQIFPDTADTAALEQWAGVWGLARKPAAAASGIIICTGADASVIPASTQWTRSDGVAYASSADATIAGGTANVTVIAVVAGLAGDCDAGIALTLVTAIAGVDAAATVGAAGIGSGADLESDDELQARILQRIQSPPTGGADGDYARWALAVPGVTRVWLYPAEQGLGTVVIRFVNDDDPDSIIPDAPLVAAVQAAIEPLRPVTAKVTVLAPVATPFAPTIALTPNTPDVRAAVAAELADLLLREAVPGGTLLLSHINEAISLAAGETDHQVLSPTHDLSYATGHIATMGAITWA